MPPHVVDTDNNVVDLGALSPGAHAATHTNGTDDIQDATLGQKGLMTQAAFTKLDGIEALADVTDATNVDAAGAVMEADYNAQTVLVAVADDTPTAQVVGDSEFVGRPAGGNVGVMTAAQARTVLNVEDGADVTDATNVNAAGAVMEVDYNAQTVLVAVADDTPAAQVVGDSEFVGRPAGGNVGVMTAAQARTVLNVEDGADVTDAANVDAAGAVMEVDFNAQTVLVAVADDTPTAQVVGDSEFVGRPSGGNVGVMTAAQARTVLNVEDGADVTDATNVQAAGAPVWQKYTVAESAFTAAAATEDIELFSLPAGGIIHAVKMKHSASFTGGTISAFTLSVGITGTLAKYHSAFDVFQAPGNTVQSVEFNPGTENHGAATSIRLAATATGDNVVNATAGSVDVWVLVSVAT